VSRRRDFIVINPRKADHDPPYTLRSTDLAPRRNPDTRIAENRGFRRAPARAAREQVLLPAG
jgi:hypothetical protein